MNDIHNRLHTQGLLAKQAKDEAIALNEKRLHPDWTFRPTVPGARHKSPTDGPKNITVSQSSPKEISERLHTTNLKGHE